MQPGSNAARINTIKYSDDNKNQAIRQGISWFHCYYEPLWMLTIENPNFWQWIVTLASICNSLMMMIWWYFRELCAITDLRPEARQTPPLQPPYQTGPPCKYNTNTLQIQYKYNTNTLLIWYKCNTDAAVTDPRIKVNCTTSSNLQLEAEDAALTALQITWPANNVLKICTSLWPALCYIAIWLHCSLLHCYIAKWLHCSLLHCTFCLANISSMHPIMHHPWIRVWPKPNAERSHL